MRRGGARDITRRLGAVVAAALLAASALGACATPDLKRKDEDQVDRPIPVPTLVPVDTGVAAPFRDVALADHSIWIGATDASRATSKKVVWRSDPTQHDITHTVPVGDDRLAIAAGDGSVWAATVRTGTPTLVRIDPKERRQISDVSLPAPVDLVAAGDGSVWLVDADGTPPVIRRYDVRTKALTAEVRLPATYRDVLDVAVGPNTLWVLAFAGDRDVIVQIDPATAKVVAEVPIPGQAGPEIVGTLGGVWLTTSADAVSAGRTVGQDPPVLRHVDQQTGKLSDPVALPYRPDGGIGFGDGAIWVVGTSTTRGAGRYGAVRVDPGTARATDAWAIDTNGATGVPTGAPTVDGKQLWYRTDSGSGTNGLVVLGPLRTTKLTKAEARKTG